MGITISRESISATHAVIERYLRVTPIVELTGSDFGLGSFPLVLKLLAGSYTPAPGERVGVVISGGNTTAVDFGGSADSSPSSGTRARGMRAGGPRRVS